MVLKRLLFIILILNLFSCNDLYKNSTRDFLNGSHELRKFNVVTKEGTRWSAGYFLIGGSASGGTFKKRKVSFSWKSKTGEFIISEIEINKIRVRINDSIEKPTVEFFSNYLPNGYESEMDRVINWVDYIILTCKEKDYPISINITDL